MTVVDLDRERRIQRLLRDLKDHLVKHPELVPRTKNYLEGGKPMATSEQQIVVRLSTTLLDRLLWLEKQLEKQPDLSSVGRVTRSSAIRLALVHGLQSLENNLQQAPSK